MNLFSFKQTSSRFTLGAISLMTLALLIAASLQTSLSAQATTVNGLNTTYVTFASPSNPAHGTFRVERDQNGKPVLIGGTTDKNNRGKEKLVRWEETSAELGGGVHMKFEEYMRDEWSVYLYDKTRDLHIQLDMYTKNINIRDGGSDWRPLYKITSATAGIIARGDARLYHAEQKKIEFFDNMPRRLVYEKGPNQYGRIHARLNQSTGDMEWTETNENKVKFYFQILKYNTWVMTLYDKGRDLYLDCDLENDTVIFRYGNNKGTLAKILEVSTGRGRAVPLSAKY